MRKIEAGFIVKAGTIYNPHVNLPEVIALLRALNPGDDFRCYFSQRKLYLYAVGEGEK